MSNCRLRTRDGGSLTVDLRLEPYLDDSGTIRGMVLSFRDTSERARIQALVDRELKNATEFHKNLLPEEAADINGVQMGSFLLAATFGAGDLYNLIKIDDRFLGFYIADVMGHGIAATSTTLLLNRLLSPDPTKGDRLVILGVDPREPKRVVERLNELFFDGRTQMFFTICYAVIDTETGNVRIARAGHPYPIAQKTDGFLQDLRAGGFAVGVTRSLEITECTIVLGPGDKLYFYSDGLTDCTDSRGMQYSRERLIFEIGETVDKNIMEAVSHIKDDVFDWRGNQSFDDDVSLIAVQMRPRSVDTNTGSMA
jgi:sigma-B regulation protein RsbU (phosphoserine phosphatase)